MPLSIIPERGQVPENGAEPSGESKSVCGTAQVPSTSRAISSGLRSTPSAFAVAELPARGAERRDVLDDDPARPDLSNETSVLRPETRALSFEPPALPGEGDVLAREPAADDIDGTRRSGTEGAAVEGSNIVMDRNVRPVAAEDAPAGLESFAEGDGAEGASPLETQGDAPDPAEEVEDGERIAPVLHGRRRHHPAGFGMTHRTSAAARMAASLRPTAF